MSQPNIPISRELQLEQAQESIVDTTHHRVENLLYQENGQTEAIRQGRQLVSEIQNDLGGKTALQKGMSTSDDLLRDAEQVNLDFEEMVINMASETGGSVLLPGLKKRERIQTKMNDEYDGDANEIRDVVRGSIVFDSIKSLYKAVAKIHSSARILYVSDRFDNPRSSGYRDMQFNLEMTTPEGRPYVVELQLHLEEMLDFKEWETSLYKERRHLEEALKKMRAQEGNPIEIRKLEEKISYLQYESQSVYAKVWERYEKGTSQSH